MVVANLSLDALRFSAAASGPCLFFFLILKRTIFSPLWQIPGPLFAKLTRRWLWVHEISYQSCQTIRELHDRLGPIVQISPNEVSVRDADLVHNVIYKQASHFLKDPSLYSHIRDTQEGLDNLFLTINPKTHSFLRRTMANSFSRRTILEIEHNLWGKSALMCERLSGMVCEKQSVDLSMMYRCLTMDVISEFAFGKRIGALDKPRFEESLLRNMNYIDIYTSLWFEMNWLRKLVLPLLERSPLPLFRAMKTIRTQVAHSLQNLNQNESPSVLFSSMESSAKRLDSELSITQLRAEGFGALFAGTDTTGTTLALGSWALFRIPAMQAVLHSELRSIWPDLDAPPTLVALESLPYLRACVKESLRFATAIPGRLPRIVPAEGLRYKEYHIPPGTIISSSAFLMHSNKDVFPDPDTFDPERWLTGDADLLKTRERHLFAFSEGSRKCIGVNLAMAELYIELASVFRRFRAIEVLTQKTHMDRIFSSVIRGGLHVSLESIDA